MRSNTVSANDLRACPEFAMGWNASALQSEVLAEHACGQELTAEQIAWFARLRVGIAALRRPFPVLTDDVVFLPGERFEFARYSKGEPVVNAHTMVVTGNDGPIDIFAWQPRKQQQALWLGQGFALGEDQILGPRLDPLEVHASVPSWLRADRRGIVILRPSVAWSRLWDAGELVVENIAQGDALERLLMPPRSQPRIFLPRKEARDSNG